jgi:peroxiredoxin Q/BCP
MPELQPGAGAPDFTLLAQSGSPVSLADYRGRKVMVFFYPKADTPG